MAVARGVPSARSGADHHAPFLESRGAERRCCMKTGVVAWIEFGPICPHRALPQFRIASDFGAPSSIMRLRILQASRASIR